MTSEQNRSDVSERHVAACVQAVSGFLDEQLGALLGSARESLLVRARDAGDPDDEGRLLAALEEVEKLGPRATDAFRGAVLEKMGVPIESPAPSSDGGDGDGLALVETAKVDDWLRLRKMLGRSTEQMRAIETELWGRLADAAGLSKHPDDCPVSMQGVCVLFQGAMQDLGAGRDARAAIYDAFESTVVANLSALVAQLVVLLDEELPEAAPYDAGAAAPAPSPGGAAGEEPGTAAPPDAGRLLDALAGAHHASADAAAPSADIEAQLAAAVARPGAAPDERERGAISALAGLVHAALAHPGLDDGVRRRLQRVAPALARLLLDGDESVESELVAARYDAVTGLLNQGAFHARLAASLHETRPDGTGPAVCLVDVDGWKKMTARLGHEPAGRLLRALGELLRKQAGASGQVARLRGDAFAVLLPAVRPTDGRRFAERCLAALAAARPVHDGETLQLRASFGVVEPGAAAEADALLHAAGVAMRAAKAEGGGRLHVHEAGSARA